MILFPELGFGVLMLTNKADHGLTLLPLEKIIEDLVCERFGPIPENEPCIETMEKLSPDDPRIQSVLGRYWESDHWTIGWEEGILGLRINAQDFHPLSFYDDAGELVGFYGTSNEIRFIPSFGDQPATMVSIDRRLLNSDFRAFNDGPFDPPGPGKKAWEAYLGAYEVLWDHEPMESIKITLRNGYLYYGEVKCVEHEPGLFFTCDGEAIDFRSDPPTAANLILRKMEHRTRYPPENLPI
jgi:hypothetical protein